MKQVLYYLLMVTAITACSKFSGDDYVNLSSSGGPWTFADVDIDGGTMTVTDGKEYAKSEYWTEASADSDALWTAEISWAYVSYQPSKKSLNLRVESNESGFKRSCTISAVSDGNVKYYYIYQSK